VSGTYTFAALGSTQSFNLCKATSTGGAGSTQVYPYLMSVAGQGSGSGDTFQVQLTYIDGSSTTFPMSGSGDKSFLLATGESIGVLVTKTSGISSSSTATIAIALQAFDPALVGALEFSGGSGYAPGDQITLSSSAFSSGGEQVYPIYPAVAVVVAAPGGVVTDWTLVRNGLIAWGALHGVPESYAQASTTGSGSGFQITTPNIAQSGSYLLNSYSSTIGAYPGDVVTLYVSYATSQNAAIAPPLSLDLSVDGGAWHTPADQTIAGGVATIQILAPAAGGHTYQVRDSCFPNHYTAISQLSIYSPPTIPPVMTGIF
jgi:hypothetical protein